MSITEDAFSAALNACWTYGGQPRFMRIGFWQNMMIEEFNERGHCRRTDELFKAVKRAEEQLARDWKRT